MRWKVMHKLAGSSVPPNNYSLGYPTKAAASTAARRLNATHQFPQGEYTVEKMTAEDEAKLTSGGRPES
jgi:hypothetical protein